MILLKNKKLIKEIVSVPNIVIIVLCILFELLVSNYEALNVIISGLPEHTLAISEKNLDDDCVGIDIIDGKLTVTGSNSSFKLTFKNVNAEMRNIHFSFLTAKTDVVDIKMRITDDNYSYDIDENKSETIMSFKLGKESEHYYLYRSCGKVKTLTLEFNNMVSEGTIESIKFNTPPAFHISLLRLAVILSVCFLIKYKVWKIEMQEKSYSLLVRNTAYICIFMFFVTVVMAITPAYEMLNDYPLSTESKEDIYAQLFDAFHNGRLNLDVDFDSSKLEALDNPYDYSERSMKGAHNAMKTWDRAYYKGKFYCYFGPVPTLFIIYPIYFITGKVASNRLQTMILGILTVISMSALYIILVKNYFKKVPILLAMIGQYSLLVGSFMFVFMADGFFYYNCELAGMACICAFLYFLFKAYFEEKSLKKRLVFLALAGVFTSLTAASRPTFILYCFIAIIPAIAIFTDKKEKLKNKIYYILSIGIPIIIGAVLIMVYNYKRFENPFEFGFNYQQTVCNSKANMITLSVIPTMLIYYFMPNLDIKSTFPYIEMIKPEFDKIGYHKYFYMDNVTGILTFPVTWCSFLFSVIDRKNKIKHLIFVSFFVIAILLTYIDTGIGGINFRYTGDFLFAYNLVGLAVIFELEAAAKKAPKNIYAAFYAAAVVMMALNIAVGTLLMM